MKTLIMLAAGILAVSVAQTASADCEGETNYPVQTASGTCTDGRCSATLSNQSIPIAGSCTDGASFHATAAAAPATLIGRCKNGEFFGIGSAENLNFEGQCSSGGTFKGSAFVRPQWTSGSCSDNGPFSVTLTPWKVSVTGTCSVPVTNPTE